MFDQVLETFRKATESTVQLQQDMFQRWMQQWVQTPLFPTTMAAAPLSNGWTDQLGAMQKKWAESVTSMLTKHREMLDEQYKAGIRALDDAFKVADAKDPEQFRRLVETLWKHSHDSSKAVIESQLRDFQSGVEKWFEVVGKGMTKT